MKYVVGNHHFSRGILVDDSGLIPPNILEIENPSFGASLCCFSRENVVFMVLKLWAFPCCPNSRTSHASDQSVSDRQAVLFVFPQLNQDISSDRAHSLAQGCTKRCRHHPHGPHIFFLAGWQVPAICLSRAARRQGARSLWRSSLGVFLVSNRQSKMRVRYGKGVLCSNCHPEICWNSERDDLKIMKWIETYWNDDFQSPRTYHEISIQ